MAMTADDVLDAEGHEAPTIALWLNGAPGTERWSQREQVTFAPPPLGFRQVRNVVNPSLTAFLPRPDRATGSAAIVCPGGAFHALAIDHEGHDVARWLQERGVAAFVLKYRLAPTDVADADFEQYIQQLLQDRAAIARATEGIVPLAVADGRQAVKVVRERAAEWNIHADRIGMVGFSAGAHVTAGVALDHDAESRPSFAAPIYGALWERVRVPEDAPPLFVAVAADDALARDDSLALYAAWSAAGKSAELHIYTRGGHGFGMRAQGLTSDRWIDQLGAWIDQQMRG